MTNVDENEVYFIALLFSKTRQDNCDSSPEHFLTTSQSVANQRSENYTLLMAAGQDCSEEEDDVHARVKME